MIFTLPFKKYHIQISYIGYKAINEEVNLVLVNEMEFFLKSSHIDLEKVIISGLTSKLEGENIVNIERSSLKTLKRTAPLILTEAISNVAGVEQRTTGSGIGKPLIRGLSGNRVVTYPQGIRFENQQWGDQHGLGVGDVGIEGLLKGLYLCFMGRMHWGESFKVSFLW